MIIYLLLGLLGLAITLVGTTARIYWLIPIGGAIIGRSSGSSVAARARRS